MAGFLENLTERLERIWPQRIHLVYLVLSVLLLVSVVPLFFYGFLVSSRNREALVRNELILQSTVTRGIAEEIRLSLQSIQAQMDGLARMVESTEAVRDVANPKHGPLLSRAIESFLGTSADVRLVTIVGMDMRGPQSGVPEVGMDAFVLQRLAEAFQTAQLGNSYSSAAFLVHHGTVTEPMVVLARPLAEGNDFRGMVATVVSLAFLEQRLESLREEGLTTYVVDRLGRLVVHADRKMFTVGQDMNEIPIVREGGLEQARMTTQFEVEANGDSVLMLGTKAAVPGLNWAVIAQKPISEAYITVYEMERYAFWLGLVAILACVGVGYYSARKLTTPLEVLAETTRAIAKGDFSRRVNLPSRTEFGELADTFNLMTDDLEKYVEQLKQAAQENHELFMGSIRTLAAAIDEKDPYTRGHSGRVSKYSVILAETLGLPEEEIYKIRISALLHDVGKIGIEDRILKKPGGLTPEEFEVMKTHTIKGAHIIRPVAMLREMLPGIELHHESLDGAGYPHGLKGDAIPRMARVIAVADTLDAMTTNRPYQAAIEIDVALQKIKAIVGKKFDPAVVEALVAAVESGKLKLTPAMIEV